jgi:hypothetical protein
MCNAKFIHRKGEDLIIVVHASGVNQGKREYFCREYAKGVPYFYRRQI